MHFNFIECRMGSTVNLGDYQSAKAEVCIRADLEPGEDVFQAFGALRDLVAASLGEALHEAKPEPVKTAPAKPATRTRKAKQANEPAAPEPAPAAAPAAPAETPKLADTADGMSVGGLDKEPTPEPAASDIDNLLGAEPEKTVTREELQAVLVRLHKIGGKAALIAVLGAVKAASLSQIPDDKLPEAYELAVEKMAELSN